MTRFQPDFSLTPTSRHILLFLCGLFVGGIAIKTLTSPVISIKRANDPEYTYINPLLSCSISENKEFTEYKPLETKINKIIGNAGPKVTSVSVYYRELTTGRWFGINEEETYSPASLMKVPIMIAYYKLAESNPSILSEALSSTSSLVVTDASEHYKSTQQLSSRQSYSIETLIEAMIKYSDNMATSLLFGHMDGNSFDDVVSDIGIKVPALSQIGGTDDFMTVKEYSYIFRLLYNGTYLSNQLSEQALKLLTQTDFTQGLRGGVPQTIAIAHKFGERTLYDTAGKPTSEQLHDCGIVYYPSHPYVLCVMTKGTDFDALSTTIQSISKSIYENGVSPWK